MKIDLKQMSVNNTAEANLWVEQTLNEILTRASCQPDIDQFSSPWNSEKQKLQMTLSNIVTYIA